MRCCLYNKITLTPEKDRNLTKRCCSFKKLEAVLDKWLTKLRQANGSRSEKRIVPDKSAQKETAVKRCDEILKANPELKAKLNAAAAEYFSKHNLPPFDSSSPADERYKMRNIILNENPKLKEEYVKAKKEYEQGQLAESSKNSPTHKDNLAPKNRR